MQPCGVQCAFGWIHDTDWGLDVRDLYGPTSVTVTASLIEASSQAGMIIDGSNATIEGTVVRAAEQDGAGIGAGITIRDNQVTHKRAIVTLRASLLEHNRLYGVFVGAPDATIQGTVVRLTRPAKDGTGGSGIVILNHPTTHKPATLTLRASLVDKSHEAGVLVGGSEATVETTVVRGTQPGSGGLAGRGIETDAS